MKREIITINEKTVTLSDSGNRTGNVTGNGIWMTAWEIAELFNVTTSAVNNAIKAIRKTDVLNDYEVASTSNWTTGCQPTCFRWKSSSPSPSG